MSEGLEFNGSHSSDLNLMMTSVSRPLFANLKDSYIDIPHKDGSILIEDNSRTDIEINVTFILMPSTNNIMNEARNIGNWLYSQQREPLVFDDDPDYVYGAKVSSQIDLEQIVYHGRFDVTFRCLPYSVK